MPSQKVGFVHDIEHFGKKADERLSAQNAHGERKIDFLRVHQILFLLINRSDDKINCFWGTFRQSCDRDRDGERKGCVVQGMFFRPYGHIVVQREGAEPSGFSFFN
jgi:hypothetical protein